VPGVNSRHESSGPVPVPGELGSATVTQDAPPAPGAGGPRAEPAGEVQAGPVPPPAPAPLSPVLARGAEREWRRRIRGRLTAVSAVGWYVAVLAVLSATAAVVLRHTVFPLLSVNNDEGIYLLHARTLADGRLFPPAPDPAGSYLPWLGTVVDGHYVLKYTPFVPAIFAAGLVVAGSIDPSLAVLAASAVVVTYLLGVELSGSRRVAALSATLLALSPLVLLQSAMVLSYLPTLVLLQATVLGVLRGRRRHRAWPVIGAGLALGVAVSVRPYDVVLLLAPLAVWLAVSSAGWRWWLLRWLACGLVLPAAIVLLTNHAATGNPLRLPFSLLEPDDRIGFGARRLYPEDGRHEFGLTDGLRSVGDHLWLLGGWACGGVVLAVAAVATAARRRLSAPGAMLGLGGLLFLLGYIGFWGAWNAAELWGGIHYVGPFYVVPVLIPLVHLGASGCVSAGSALLARGRRLGLAVISPVVAAVVALTVVVLTGALRDNLTLTSHDRALRGMIDRAPGESVVFVAVNPRYLGHPTPVTANGPNLGGRVLYAVARGVDDLAVVADHPERTPYLLRLPAGYDRAPGSSAAARLERLTVRQGDRVPLTITVGAHPATFRARSARLLLTLGTRGLSVQIDPRAGATVTLALDAHGLDPADLTSVVGTRGRPTASVLRNGRGTSLTARVRATDARGHEHTVDEQILPVRRSAGEAAITVLGSSGQVEAVGEGARPPLRVTFAGG